MFRGKSVSALALLTVVGFGVVGCPGFVAPPIAVPVELGEGLGQFTVNANQAAQNAGTTAFGAPVAVAGASLQFNADDITITPTDQAKTTGNGTQTGQVTAWIAPAAQVATVCGGGEQYGPFTVTFDDSLNVLSVTPSSVTLSQNTVDLLNGGEISLCIEIIWPIDATVTIEQLTLNVSTLPFG